MKRYFIGEACLCWSLGDSIQKETSDKILTIYRRIKAMPDLHALGVLDLVPSYNALAIHFDPVAVQLEELEQALAPILDGAYPDDTTAPVGRVHVLPVAYNGEDLNRVAGQSGLSMQEVIRIHQAPNYTVAMVGFLPHFPYLIGLDPRLVTPRLSTPRKRVPAGSVGIGGAQTGVYPSESPGGWNLIGSTDPRLLLPVKPGDSLRFKEA